MSNATSNPRPIVLIDASSDYGLVLRQLFRQAGVLNAFIHFRSGEDAISFFKEGIQRSEPIPRLILLEIDLPGIDGFQTLSWVRNCPSFVEVPVVMLTKSELQTHIQRAENLKANSFLTKPPSITGLVEIVSGLKEQWLEAE